MLQFRYRVGELIDAMLQIGPPRDQIVQLGRVRVDRGRVASELDAEIIHGLGDLVHVLLHGGIHGLDLYAGLTKTPGFDEQSQIGVGKWWWLSLIPDVRDWMEFS